MMENGTRSVDSFHIDVFNCCHEINLHQGTKMDTLIFVMCVVTVLIVGHIQFGEEEVSTGGGWDQSSGWSADTHRVDIHTAVCVSCVPGQCPQVPSQGVKGTEKKRVRAVSSHKRTQTACSRIVLCLNS